MGRYNIPSPYIFTVSYSRADLHNILVLIEARFDEKPVDELTLIDTHAHMEILWRKWPWRACDSMRDRYGGHTDFPPQFDQQ